MILHLDVLYTHTPPQSSFPVNPPNAELGFLYDIAFSTDYPNLGV